MAGGSMKKSQAITIRIFSGAGAAMVFLMPDVAAAHLVTTGLGPVYDGIGHLLLTPEDLIPAMAVALYAGLRGKAPGRRALFFFPLAWMAGGLFGLMVTGTPIFPLPILSFLLLGALIAADLRLPDNIVTTLVIAVGIIHGFYNGIAMEGGPGISGLFGITATLFVLVAIASAFVISLQAVWARVAVRVTGSWIAAIGLLMFGWLAKGNG
jgi:hydrogenase/urease accessory protein HupE